MATTDEGLLDAHAPRPSAPDPELELKATADGATAEGPGQEAAFPEGFDETEWEEEGVDAAYLQSKYTLVSVAAKRARQILAGSQRRVESLSEKPVTVALEELSAGKLYFERTRDGIK